MLGSHGLTYTPEQARSMTQRDRDALLSVIEERVIERDRARASREAREQALGGLSKRRGGP